MPEAPPIGALVEDISTEFDVVPSEPEVFAKERVPKKPSKPKLKLRVGRILVTLLVLAGLALGGWQAAEFLLAPVTVPVADMIGMELADARREARANELEVEVERVLDLKAPAGEVVAQSPDGGELEEGATLSLVVSDGQPRIRVPSMKGEPASLARARITASGFEIGRVVRRYSSPVPRGDVVRQLPGKGKHDWGSKVHLVVSKGPPPVDIPQLEGELGVFAVKRLERAGLRVEQIDVYSETVDAGLVISTKPAGGKTVKKGSRIEVVVSLGPEFEKVTLPDLRGERVDSAVAELSSLGLQADVVGSCKKSKRVVESDPVGGTTVTENDVITLFTC